MSARLPPVTHDPYVSLRIPAFRWFIVSLLTMTVAAQIQVVVVSWQIYEVTRDPLSLGLIGLAEALPFIGVALYAGHLADRFDRRRISLLSLAVLVLCALALLALSLGAAPGAGIWPYYGVIAVSGLARSFLQPARQALGAEIVPREHYANASAWRSSTWQTAAVLGPAVAGLLYGFAGPTVGYVVQAVLMAVAFATFAGIVYAAKLVPETGESMRESLLSGFRFLRSEPLLLGALTLDLFSVLLGGAEALLPVFADRILHVGPEGLGVLRAAPAAGAVLMSVYIAHRAPFRRAGRTLLLAVAGFAICILIFGLSRSFYLSLVALVLSGMADNVSVVIRSTMLQTFTPSHLLGRVSAVNSIFIGSSNEIGAFESGVTAKLMGVVGAVIFGGAASLGAVATIAALNPRLRRLGPIQSGSDPGV